MHANYIKMHIAKYQISQKQRLIRGAGRGNSCCFDSMEINLTSLWNTDFGFLMTNLVTGWNASRLVVQKEAFGPEFMNNK